MASKILLTTVSTILPILKPIDSKVFRGQNSQAVTLVCIEKVIWSEPSAWRQTVTAMERKELELLLAMEKDRRRNAVERRRETEKLSEMRLKQISDIKRQLSFAEEQCSVLQDQYTTLQEQHSTLQQQHSELRDQFHMMSNELAELKAQVEMRKSFSSLSHGTLWQYEIDGHWEAFPPEANEKMLEAYLEYLKDQHGCRYATINSGGVDREVDFQLEQQQHRRTRTLRQIRLLTGAPVQWITPAADLLRQGNHVKPFYVEVTDGRIWETIRTILRTSGHALDPTSPCSCMNKAEIKTVHRIENIRLWHRYKARLAAMRQDNATSNIAVGSTDLDLDGAFPIMADSQKTLDCGEKLALDVDEKILLHGTSWDNANSIVREGFDHRTCYGGMYGAGVYFACAACKSNQYTCNLHKTPGSMPFCTCERTLIIARVALGDAYVAKEIRNDRRPPMRAGSGTYDSIVVKPGFISGHHNSQQVHQEFVIFDREQAYPCYVVQYTVWAWPVGNWASKIFNVGIELEKTEAVDLRVQKRFGAASAAADSSV